MSNAEYIAREVQARAKDEMDARAVLDAAASEKRDLTPEEEARFDKFIESSDARKARIEKLKKLDADNEALAEVREIAAQVLDTKGGETKSGPFQDRLLAAIGDAKTEYKRTGLNTADRMVEGKINLDELRAIADFSDNGALYTTDFSTKVAVYQRTVSPWINHASIINADNGRPINLPNLTVDASVVAPGEGTAITESTPTVGSAALTTTAYKGLSYVSAEAEEDELIGLLDYIARSQGRSIGLKFGSDLTVALLAAMTNGGTASGTGGVGTAASAFFGYEDLIDLKYSLQAPYRDSGSWVMAKNAIKKVRKFRDQNGSYFFTAASNPQTADMFDGNPIFEDPNLAAPQSASKSVVFGDLNLVIVKQMPLRVATSLEFRFNQDQVAIKTVYRAGGALPDVTGLAFLVSANT